ncbi:MAG TPA: hypothetical protein VHS13_10165 [Edaphobacter sp.]|nr:hypothetical protein [Edaphobacter sp.]
MQPANRTFRPIVSTSHAIDYALGHGGVGRGVVRTSPPMAETVN